MKDIDALYDIIYQHLRKQYGAQECLLAAYKLAALAKKGLRLEKAANNTARSTAARMPSQAARRRRTARKR